MPAVRFCSECGEQIPTRRGASLPFRSFCRHCSPKFNASRAILFFASLACIAVAFALGQFTSKHEPFYFIGERVPSTSTRLRTNEWKEQTPAENISPPERLVIAPSSDQTICGAPTKSGKPCQRRVKGGGYCWQHRDKFVNRKAAQPGSK
jgi:hypothetical protein